MIQLQLFGAVDLRRDGVEVRSVLAQPKRLALLAYLASATPRGFHSRDTLLGLFWPESDQERARNSLRQALHQLRRSLGEEVVVGRGDREVGLEPSLAWCDAVAFDEAVGEGRHEDALKLYRGDLLPGFYLEDTPEAERWIEEERARYRRAATEAAWRLAEAEEARGEWRAAALWAQRASALLPPEETAVRRLLTLLERAGEPAVALEAFAEFERRLRQEYDLAPSDETLRQVERLRRPARPASSAHASEPEPSPRTASSPTTTPDSLRRTPLPDSPMSDSAAGEMEAAETEATGAASPADADSPRLALTPSPALVPAKVTVATVTAGAAPRPVRRWRLPVGMVAAAVAIALTGGGVAAWRARTAAPAEPASVAVLPFLNLSGDSTKQYFSDGLSEELLNVLAQLPELRVASRTSSFKYRGNEIPVDSVGRALRVAHVLEGSVRQSGDRVRITAQLIDARTGYHVWSQTYDRDLRDIFAVQDEISRAIVTTLQVKLSRGRAAGPLARRQTADPEAHALALKAGYVMGRPTREGLAQAEAFYAEAIRRDPAYARAHAGLASTLQSQAYRRYIPAEEGYARARAAASRALALDSAQLTAHAVLARIAELQEWDFAAAERHYQQAVARNPSAELGHTARAFLLVRLGRNDEAVEAARKSVQIRPDYPSSYSNLGGVLGYARRYEESLQAFAAALALDPGHSSATLGTALTLSYLDRHAEAVRAAMEIHQQRGGDQYVLAMLGYVQARAGHAAEARVALRELEALPEPSPYLRAMVYAGLGDRERAFALLDRAVTERDGGAPDLGIDPSFDSLRGDPRMAALLRRIGLPAPR